LVQIENDVSGIGWRRGNGRTDAMTVNSTDLMEPSGPDRRLSAGAFTAFCGGIAHQYRTSVTLRRDNAYLSESSIMNTTTKIAAALVAVLMLASCGNTIRGVGRDASNTVNATKDAANDVAN
jgi:predicted small secreted protein